MVGKSATSAFVLFLACATPAHAQFPGGIIGNIINNMQQQQQAQQQAQQQQQLLQQQQLQRQIQQQQQQQQQQEQQQAQDARQRAQADARARADADAKARQRQADIERQKQQAEVAAKAAAEERRTQEVLKKLRADPVLVAVIGSDKSDITALIAGQDTPNVVRNLQGDPAFQQNPTLCMPFGGIVSDPNTPEWRFLSSAQTAIEQKGGGAIVMTACDPAQMDHYDLVVFSADQVANGPLNVLSAVVDALRQRQFVPFATFTMADFEAGERAKVTAAREAAARQSAARDAARGAFQARDSSLYSTIYATSPAAVVCLVSSTDTVGLRYLLTRKDSPFAGVVAASSTIRDLPSADAIFIGFKRHECNAAVAPTGLLKPVLAALGRDNVAIDVHPGSIAAARLEGWKDLAATDAAAAKEAVARNAAETLRQQTEQVADEEQRLALAAEHRRNDEASRREQLAAIRAAVVVKSTGIVDQFAQLLRRHMDSVRSELAETTQRIQTGQVLSTQEQIANRSKYAADRVDSFRPWSDAFADRTKEGWTFADIKPGLEDFGQAQWHSRSIDAISIRVEFPMLNRVIGERQTLCYDFVFIDDEEFNFMRQATAIPCDQYIPSFVLWSQANSFVSEWKLLPPKT